MKLKHSFFTRRQFLNGLLGGWAGAFMLSFLYPALKFCFPPTREPDQVVLPFSDFEDMESGSVRNFSWGTKPGMLKKRADSSYQAFVAVCTHLDCNVVYLPDKKKFFCACHEGWYDENGVNIGGPPPKPLRQLTVSREGEELVITKKSAE